MRIKPTIGQTLYQVTLKGYGHTVEPIVTPVIVRSVGRKYFSCSSEENPLPTKEYVIETWREHSDYAPDTKLYGSMQEYRDYVELQSLAKEIGECFEYGQNIWSLSVEALRQIKAIIESAKR